MELVTTQVITIQSSQDYKTRVQLQTSTKNELKITWKSKTTLGNKADYYISFRILIANN